MNEGPPSRRNIPIDDGPRQNIPIKDVQSESAPASILPPYIFPLSGSRYFL
jgi:hypothetical protein